MTSRDPGDNGLGLYGVDVIRSLRDGAGLLEWIPVNTPLYARRRKSSSKLCGYRSDKNTVVSVYVSTDCRL